jgi:hypothetical protein
MNQFLEQCLDRPATFTLNPTDGSGTRSTVLIQAKYIPVDMQILPRESINSASLSFPSSPFLSFLPRRS